MLLASGASPRPQSHGPTCVYARPARRKRAGRLPVAAATGGRRAGLGRLGADRRVGPTLVVALVLLTSLFAILPAASAQPRAAEAFVNPAIADLRGVQPDDVSAPSATVRPLMSEEAPVAASGPFAADGTLLAPRTGQPSPAPLEMRLYSVVHGDTLTGIAAHFGLSMMTIWWANTLTSKDQLHVGQVLRIPLVDGVLYTAQEGDTVTAVAARFHADPAAVTTYNSLATGELTLGQQVMIPNGVGSSIAVAATAHPTAKAASGGTTGCTSCGFAPLAWPVPGGYISQGFGCTGFPYEPAFGNCAHYHYGIDIAAPNGTPVLAAAAGTVTFAGWRDNDGGYQVTISDGHDYYTGYYHLSALLVHAGQHVGRGQLIARVGSTGHSTGPHLLFVVSIGPILAGGTAVNPLNYF